MIFNALPLNSGNIFNGYEVELTLIYYYHSIYYQEQLDNYLAHSKQFLDHVLHLLIDPFEVAVEQDFLFPVILELVDFG